MVRIPLRLSSVLALGAQLRTPTWILVGLTTLGIFFLIPPGRPQEVGPLPGARPRSVYAPYYTVRDGWRAILGLNNTTRAAFTVYPTLYTLDGAAAPMPPIPLEAHEHRKLDLGEWVAQLGEEFARGSVRLDYESVGFGLGAMVTLVNEPASLVLNVLARPRGEFRSSRLEGIWWAPEPTGRLSLAVLNTTDNTRNAGLVITGGNGEQLKSLSLPLAPHQARVVQLQDVLARKGKLVGGVTILHDGPPGAVMAQGFVWVSGSGFSANLPLVDPAWLGSSKLSGAGILLGTALQFSGYLVLRNTSTEPVNASPVLQGGTDRASLPDVTLRPGESREIRVTPDILSASAPIGIEVSHTGLPPSVVGHWLSVDESGSLVIETPLRSAAPTDRTSGNHPFTLEGDTTAVAYIKNTGNEKALFVASIWHSGGDYVLGLKEVESGQTVAIDIRNLRDEQVPDVEGRKLPPDLLSGQIIWRWRAGPPLVGRLNLMSASRGLASNMSCAGCCCSPTSASLFLIPAFTFATSGDVVPEQVWERDTMCDAPDQTYPIPGYLVSWDSSNPAVASPDGQGLVFCSLPGSATVRAFGSLPIGNECIYVPGCEPQLDVECDCVTDYQFAEAFAGFQVFPPPTVSISGPANVPLRAASSTGPNSITLTATGSPSGGTFSWSTTSTKVMLSNTTSATVTVTSAAESTAIGDVPISVTYKVNNRSASATQNITVQKPTSLAVVSDTGSVQDFDCLATFGLNYRGVRRDILYQVKDRFVRPIEFANMPAEESFAAGSNSCAGVPPTPTPENGFTLSNGNFNGVDRFALCSSSCLPADPNGFPTGSCSLSFTQTWRVNGFAVRTNAVTMTCTSVTVTAQ